MMFELLQLLNISPDDYGTYIRLWEYTLRNSSQPQWYNYISSLLWLGLALTFIRDKIVEGYLHWVKRDL